MNADGTENNGYSFIPDTKTNNDQIPHKDRHKDRFAITKTSSCRRLMQGILRQKEGKAKRGDNLC